MSDSENHKLKHLSFFKELIESNKRFVGCSIHLEHDDEDEERFTMLGWIIIDLKNQGMNVTGVLCNHFIEGVDLSAEEIYMTGPNGFVLVDEAFTAKLCQAAEIEFNKDPTHSPKLREPTDYDRDYTLPSAPLWSEIAPPQRLN